MSNIKCQCRWEFDIFSILLRCSKGLFLFNLAFLELPVGYFCIQWQEKNKFGRKIKMIGTRGGEEYRWTMSSDLRPTVPKFRRSWKIDSKFRLRYRIEFCQKSPFRRKSRVSQGHKISAKFWKLRKLRKIRKLRKFRYSAIPRFSQRWNYCPKSENP